MKKFIVSILIATAACSVTGLRAQQPKNMIQFFQPVDSLTEFPPVDQELVKICQKQVDRRYVTFVGFKGDPKVVLAAVTLEPIDSLQHSIILSVDFDGIKPLAGKVTTWGYVFDRNGDGKIDYMALVGGAAAYEPEDFPEDFPDKKTDMSMEQIDYFVGHCRIVFDHWADDNFDGKIDGVVHVDLDPDREWVAREIVVRSRKFNGKFDDAWAFRGRIDEGGEQIKHTSSAVPYHPIGKTDDEITPATLADKTDILKLMNKAAKLCGMAKDSFRQVPYGQQ